MSKIEQTEDQIEYLNNKERILYSIAISLKRIADSLEAPEITPFDIPNLTSEQLFSLQEKWNKGHD